MKRVQYKTKQWMELEQYLKANKQKHLTVGEILAFFKAKGMNIGKATVYRHLERMVAEGSVRKYVLDSGERACFEYTGTQACHWVPMHFHLKCEKCGILIHLECRELGEIGTHLMQEHDFYIDHTRTVFYGLCKECKEKSMNGGLS